MVSKVFSGHSFYHACRYVVNKPGAEVLEYEGVRGHDYRLMSDDFIMQQQMRPEKEKACFHCSLSFYPGEVLKDELMVKISKEYLERLGINNTQFNSKEILRFYKSYFFTINSSTKLDRGLLKRQTNSGINTNPPPRASFIPLLA